MYRMFQTNDKWSVDTMGKVVKTEYGKGKRINAKKSSHGSERAKRKPNSPIVQCKLREQAAAQFGKSPEFRKAVYGIVEETADE